MSDNYTSVLFCIRDGITEVYENGLPVGALKGDKFELHNHKLPDGSLKQVKPLSEDVYHAVAAALHAAT